jgi:hypothetical protein
LKLTRQQTNQARELTVLGKKSRGAVAELIGVDVKTRRRALAMGPCTVPQIST